MKQLLLLLLWISLNKCKNRKEESCDKIRIHGQWYEREVFLTNSGTPSNLHVHKATNTLFFSYSLPNIYTDIGFQLVLVNLDTKDQQIIGGIKGGCAIAIDPKYDAIYLGGTNGIYVFNSLTYSADFYREKGKNIWSLYFKDTLFYISYPNQTLYVEVDGVFKKVKEFEGFEVDIFHVCSTYDTYLFANKTGLYKLDSMTMVTRVLIELIYVRQIVEDDSGLVYICTNFGILTYSLIDETIKKILDLRNVYGIAFDKNNQLVIAENKNIVKLRRTSPCVYNKQ